MKSPYSIIPAGRALLVLNKNIIVYKLLVLDRNTWNHTTVYGVSPRGVVANLMDYDIVVCKFELQSRYYVHFQTNTHE